MNYLKKLLFSILKLYYLFDRLYFNFFNSKKKEK